MALTISVLHWDFFCVVAARVAYTGLAGWFSVALIDTLDTLFGLRKALVVGFVVAAASVYVVMPMAIRKLLGAGIVGHDVNKPGRPAVPEMGGLVVFLAFNAAVFVMLALGDLNRAEESLVLVSLMVAAGAAITGILDDLVALRQQFKAFIPIAFSIPLVLYAEDSIIQFPGLAFDFGPLYALVLVPLAVAAASNGFNMLEGFNGLGAGMGLIIGAGMAVIAYASGNLLGLVILVPLLGAIVAFLTYNMYPAKVFPGDTFTLLVGAVLAAASMLSKIEFWAALLFLPHVLEFFLKARGRFGTQSFAKEVHNGTMHYEGPIHSLTHVAMRSGTHTEPKVVLLMWSGMAVYVAAVVVAYFVVGASSL